MFDARSVPNYYRNPLVTMFINDMPYGVTAPQRVTGRIHFVTIAAIRHSELLAESIFVTIAAIHHGLCSLI